MGLVIPIIGQINTSDIAFTLLGQPLWFSMLSDNRLIVWFVLMIAF